MQLPDFQDVVKPFRFDRRINVSALQNYDSWSSTIAQEDLLDGMNLLDTRLTGRMPTCKCIHNV
jgi:hypothetical protein